MPCPKNATTCSLARTNKWIKIIKKNYLKLTENNLKKTLPKSWLSTRISHLVIIYETGSRKGKQKLYQENFYQEYCLTSEDINGNLFSRGWWNSAQNYPLILLFPSRNKTMWYIKCMKGPFNQRIKSSYFKGSILYKLPQNL